MNQGHSQREGQTGLAYLEIFQLKFFTSSSCWLSVTLDRDPMLPEARGMNQGHSQREGQTGLAYIFGDV